MIGFGAGDVFATPNVANPSCLRMGQLQETNVDISFETKKAYGGRQFPFAIARGKGSIKGKTKAGIFQPSLVKSILTGATQVTGQRLLKLKESTGAIVGSESPGTPQLDQLNDPGPGAAGWPGRTTGAS